MRELKDAVLKIVKERIGTSFPELLRELPGGPEKYKGEYTIELHANCVLWGGVTDEFYTAISELLRDKELAIKPCEFLIYMIDGESLNLPLVKRKIVGLKKPRWLPVTLYIHGSKDYEDAIAEAEE